MPQFGKIGRAPLAVFLTVGLALLVSAIIAPGMGHGNTVLASGGKPGPQLRVAQDGGRLGSNVIKQTLYTLKEEYVEKVNYNALLKTAAEGVKIYLKEKKLTYGGLDGFPKGTSADANLNEFQEDLGKIENKYRGKIQGQKLLYYALKGLMFGLKDPYSVALEPKEFRHLKESMSGGNFGGVGIYIELDRHNHNQLIVVEPIEDTQLAHAGLKSGDMILRIDSTDTRGIDLEVAANRIRGPVGSTVKLVVKRSGVTKEYALIRNLIHVKSATGKMMPNNVGYIRLRFFGEDTDSEVESALVALEKKGMKALILDVRNNGGGYINAARDVCNKFLPSGQTIVSVVNYRKGTNEVHKANGTQHRHVPMAVLINAYSASASEITAGALHDTNVATLVGMKSFGKGSVQTLHEMADGGALKFTIAHYLTPSGADINKKGIKPDIEVKMPATEVGTAKDLQLTKAESFLKGKLAGR